MRKASSLREWLALALPEYQENPEKLHVYVEGGTVRSRKGKSLGFTYAYTIKALLTDFVGDDLDVCVAVLAWIEKEQPELLLRPSDEPFSFAAELLDETTVDLEITVAVTESVQVTLRPDQSGYDAVSLPEPDPSPGFEAVGDTGFSPKFLQGFGNLAELVRTSSPDAELTDAVPPAA